MTDALPASWGRFDPDPSAFVAAMRPLVDESVVSHIATLDAGQNIAAHASALRRLAREGVVAAPMPWEPRETLSLARHGDPERDFAGERGAQPDRLRGHVVHVFCCGTLLREACRTENRELDLSCGADVARLVRSAAALGANEARGSKREAKDAARRAAAPGAARRLLAWCAAQPVEWNWDDAPVHMALGAVLLATHDGAIDDEALADAARWIMDVARRRPTRGDREEAALWRSACAATIGRSPERAGLRELAAWLS